MRLLLIDDDPDDRLLIIRELHKQFNSIAITEVSEEVEFEITLNNWNFDIVITDYNLQWSDGLDIFERIKIEHPETPVIMVTGTGNEELAKEALKAGMQGYISKSYQHYKQLPDSIKNTLNGTNQ